MSVPASASGVGSVQVAPSSLERDRLSRSQFWKTRTTSPDERAIGTGSLCEQSSLSGWAIGVTGPHVAPLSSERRTTRYRGSRSRGDSGRASANANSVPEEVETIAGMRKVSMPSSPPSKTTEVPAVASAGGAVVDGDAGVVEVGADAVVVEPGASSCSPASSSPLHAPTSNTSAARRDRTGRSRMSAT